MDHYTFVALNRKLCFQSIVWTALTGGTDYGRKNTNSADFYAIAIHQKNIEIVKVNNK